ncbi:hypothetical protein A2Z67_04500 [Candidatus Woesebacteria bacterium RBG_13_36_22]|uniref:Uncharacterized protein n=1 Tax=Candidatus Woesebacteria bacterium RBG_13_36_22 TaxID=1802478 RepID=A0A1F7X2R5_9BACT|nr:MAG: hypothetical protein A2Z67_04500 [Candidatus Woesebacteria bacterium RBG_13_36_22]
MSLSLYGQRFGKLMAIGPDTVGAITVNGTKRKRRYWRCRCDCGKLTVVSTFHLRSGHTKSCGCLRTKNPKRVNTRRLDYGESSKTYVINCYKRHARNIKVEFNLTREECINLFSKNCNYCGSPPTNKVEKKGLYGIFIYNGIDRIDSRRGYKKDNCVSCCKICNGMKRDMAIKDFYTQLQKIQEFTKNTNCGGAT